jgi:hypothetical protein
VEQRSKLARNRKKGLEIGSRELLDIYGETNMEGSTFLFALPFIDFPWPCFKFLNFFSPILLSFFYDLSFSPSHALSLTPLFDPDDETRTPYNIASNGRSRTPKWVHSIADPSGCSLTLEGLVGPMAAGGGNGQGCGREVLGWAGHAR